MDKRMLLSPCKPKNPNKKAGKLSAPKFFPRSLEDRSRYVPGCGKR